jgi:hypothetical protein
MDENKLHDSGSIRFALKYPFNKDTGKYNAALIGFALTLLSAFIIPAFILLGYNFRLKEYAAKGKEEPPSYKNYIELLKEGFYAFVAYLPLLLLMGILVALAVILPENVGSVLVILGYIFVVAATPIVGVVYAVKRDIVETYTGSEVYDLLFSFNYLLAVVKYFLLSILIAIIFLVGGIVTLGLGIILLMPLFIYVRPAFWGHIYYNWNSSR